MFKKTLTFVKTHKKAVGRKALIVLGTVVGGIIALGVVDNLRAQKEEQEVLEGEVIDSE